MQQVPVC